MLRMISLDWRAMKYYWLRAAMLVLVITIGVISPALILPMEVFCFLSYSINPFAMEEKGQLDHLYLTLPVSRKTIVRARYALSLIIQLPAFIIGISATYFFAGIQNNTVNHIGNVYFSMNGKMILVIAALSFAFYALMNLCMFPILFKIGYTKGKAMGFYIPVLFFIGLIYIFMLGLYFSDSVINVVLNGISWSYDNTGLLVILILTASLAILGISYLLSLHFYKKREF